MPLEAPLAPISQRIADLNARYRNHGAVSVLSHALADPMLGKIALVSSFGAESVVLLHLISIMDRTTPVLFIDTELLFAETLHYQETLAEAFGLSDIRRLTTPRDQIFERDPDNLLRHFDPDACCHLRKIEPLQKGLSGFDAWVTGRKRYQGGLRQKIEFFEAENAERIKINPLAHWGRDDLEDYIANNNLPRHPLVAKGYPSIGCAPCTTQVNLGEDIRAGRWRNTDKIECGIHFDENGVTRPEKDAA
ncbi:MAG: phosphoadenylyl-sulfate reductase [Alphaproteobacteria bacterium]|nr:phosphoadenylyl-sulfate reductase [Alphaproteobacteria bacterium]